MGMRLVAGVCLALIVTSQPWAAERSLRLAAANTAAETGLLDALVSEFTRAHPGYEVEVTVSGGLVALDAGRAGKVDAVLTHHPASEELFLAEGYGLSRHTVMHSRYVILGPPDDPLELGDLPEIGSVLQRLADNEVDFLVPGEKSGTYQKLAELWAASGREPDWLGYESTGASAGATVRTAATFGTYAFADWSTYLTNRDDLDGKLAPLFAGNGLMRNSYSLVVVDPAKVPGANREAAELFRAFLLSVPCQESIARFGQERFQVAVFEPAAL